MTFPVRTLRSGISGLGLLILCFARTVTVAAPTFDECDRKVRDSPEDLASYECYADAASASGRFDAAVSRLAAAKGIESHKASRFKWRSAQGRMPSWNSVT